ncbi:ABC transporter permease [Treponema primitia]|uniref:ABC transporter permease n=1 Tax=Treponema primitia TaxID=88058 RepID=UPI0002F11520|nr:FtsX-like permease family protein [Treponema primitia]
MNWQLMLKNITRNKKNSLVIILLIGVITFILFIGNSILGKSDQGLRNAFVESLTGDVVIQKTSDVTMNLFGANTPVIDEYFNIPSFPAYDMVRELILEEPGISVVTSQVSSRAFLDALGVREGVLLCGIDASTYFTAFPGILLEEGRFLEANEYGVMISADRAERIEKQTGQRPAIGDSLLLTAGGTTGFKIRDVPLVGIYRYRNPGTFMNKIVIADPQTVRVLESIQVAASDIELDQKDSLLFGIDLDDFFSGDFGREGDEEESFSVDFLKNVLQNSKEEADQQNIPVGGDWNFIILRLKKGVNPGAVIASLNKKLAPFEVTAVGWRIAAGSSAILMLLIKNLFNIGMFLVSVAGIIAAVNILLISVFRRTKEIGALRAMGAYDGYIRTLILGENLILACIAGILGILGGYCFLRIINGFDIIISNTLIASLLDDQMVQISFLPSAALASFGVSLFLGIAASLYPVEMAVRVNPIVAVRQG